MFKALVFAQSLAIVLKLFFFTNVSWYTILIPTYALIIVVITLMELVFSMKHTPHKWIKTKQLIEQSLLEQEGK